MSPVIINESELNVLYHCGYRDYTWRPGSFTSALIEAIMCADVYNRARLALGFPRVVDAVDSYQNGDLMSRYMEYCKEKAEAALQAARVQSAAESVREAIHTKTAALEKGVCAMCGWPAGVFRDKLSESEYRISALCQRCQDEIFGQRDGQ